MDFVVISAGPAGLVAALRATCESATWLRFRSPFPATPGSLSEQHTVLPSAKCRRRSGRTTANDYDIHQVRSVRGLSGNCQLRQVTECMCFSAGDVRTIGTLSLFRLAVTAVSRA